MNVLKFATFDEFQILCMTGGIYLDLTLFVSVTSTFITEISESHYFGREFP